MEILSNNLYTYNDLKPENIMLCNSRDGSLKVTLVDFGFAQKYVNEYGTHYNEDSCNEMFQGNLMFSSFNLLDFKTPCRKDDLISICYLLIFLLNFGKIPKFESIFSDEFS